MNKENSKGAAGLRRSAIAERIRLREEWSALKGTESQQANVKQNHVLTKKESNIKTTAGVVKNVTNLNNRCRKPSSRNMSQVSDTLCGVVALVEVGSESRALPLRAALSALGASVLPAWNPLVTHLVWSEGGSRATRAKARALACRLVSPLWVEAMAACSQRLPERAFPAAARASDLPSPATLRGLLKKAEMENIPITDLLDSSDENQKMLRLRISSETEQDTSGDTTGDISRDSSRDISHNTTTSKESRVNTAPRRALPMSTSMSPQPPTKSRRKLFTQKELNLTTNTDDEEEEEEEEECPIMPRVRKPSYKRTTKKKPEPPEPVKVIQPRIDRKGLARAERLARKLVAGLDTKKTASQRTDKDVPRIVLTGMSSTERKIVSEAIKSLKGRVLAGVNRSTTHVLLGTFLPDDQYNKTFMTGIEPLSPNYQVPSKPRTVAALAGAARGCRILYARWALDSKEKGKWLHHCGYEVLHLRKISQDARIERYALGKLNSEYAYDVFCGMRALVSSEAENRAGAVSLLRLCGAILIHHADNDDTQNGHPRPRHGDLDGPSQYYVTQYPDVEYDVKIGRDVGDVDSKWVFDSVASGRMRTTRRYVTRRNDSQDELFAQLQSLGC